ncbi:thioesterase, FlK family [Roseobacter sp.]|uniref:thioesterase, FlK family n=1 Tax=Roseobacter sp. TaxID=1907202 RepID=UPI00385962A2
MTMQNDTVPKKGQMALFRAEVNTSRTATALEREGGAPLPPVFRKPFLITDIQRARANLRTAPFGQDEVSVGGKIDVRHLAPASIGGVVTTVANFSGQAGALCWFDFRTNDAAGKVGEGQIARTNLNARQLTQKSDTRK